MTNQYLFGNFFETETLKDIQPADTTIFVPAVDTLKLPIVGAAQQAQLVLWDGVQDPEIVACTSNPQSGTLTVVRGQEGTSARAWAAGTQVRSSITAEILNAALAAFFNFNTVLAANFLPLSGGTLTGPLNLPADPLVALGAATKQYVDAVQGNKLPLSGGTMTGTINMNNNRIVSLPVPIATTEPVRGVELTAEATIRANFNSDNAGQLLTAGTGSAYTVTTATKPGLVDGACLRTKFHTTNLRAPTLTIDTAAPAPIQLTSGVPLAAGTLQANMPYSLVYSLAASAWLLAGIPQPGFTTGDFKMTINTVADPGWIMCNDQTIGNISSGANFADASAQELYIRLWTNVADAQAPVTSGRGANGLADWNAQKPMALTKMLGRALAAGGAGAGLTARVLGFTIGEENHLLTAGETPLHTHSITDQTHVHSPGQGGSTFVVNGSAGANATIQTGSNAYQTTATTAAASTGITSTNSAGGATPPGGTTHNNMQPSSFVNVMLKL